MAQAQHQDALIQEKLNHSYHDSAEQHKAIEQLKSEQENMQKMLIVDIKAMQISHFLGNFYDELIFGNSEQWLQQLQQQISKFEQKTEQQQALSTSLLSVEQSEVQITEQVKLFQQELAKAQLQLAALNSQLKDAIELRVTHFVEMGYVDEKAQTSDFIVNILAEQVENSKAKLVMLQNDKQEIEARLQQLIGQEQRAKQHLIEHEQAIIEADKELARIVKNSKDDIKSLKRLSLVEIESELENLNEQLKQQQIKVGQIQQVIGHDQQSKNKQQILQKQIETKQNTVDELAYLNGLIGSADGAKFRKFAQGLTLNHLVFLANEQLNNLDGRYQLQCQQNETLSLEVLDTWQGDSIRDTKTLSGGESFLVSLALALALSDLVSSKTSIDSLFLDEGFGTLDSDTLEIALNALDSLNASGKMIGIISHIEALKERIAVQVKVEKQSGLGVSCLDKQFVYNQ